MAVKPFFFFFSLYETPFAVIIQLPERRREAEKPSLTGAVKAVSRLALIIILYLCVGVGERE